jgi:hypothetical protein
LQVPFGQLADPQQTLSTQLSPEPHAESPAHGFPSVARPAQWPVASQ